MRRLASLVSVVVVLIGLVALGAQPDATAQEDVLKAGESVFEEGATAELLASGAIPFYPPAPAEIALQRVRIAPGSSIVTPADDPRLILVYVESGTLTVRNTVPTLVTRATQDQEAVPAETEFTAGAGDSWVSPAESGGTFRNEGTEEVTILAALVLSAPDGAATPAAGTPVP